MPAKLLQNAHFIKGIDPVADAFAGTANTDIINFNDYHSIVFVVYWGVGTTGTTVVTVDACDDVSASNTTAIPFRYKAITSGDTEGALTAATTSGFTTTAGSSSIYLVEVDSQEMGDTGYQYVRLTLTESVDDPILGGVMAIGYGPRYAQDVPATAIV
tara:strand:- start:6806 stop:7279 length:474 start_codon:yes stop_codon:yes gene_type:complete